VLNVRIYTAKQRVLFYSPVIPLASLYFAFAVDSRSDIKQPSRVRLSSLVDLRGIV